MMKRLIPLAILLMAVACTKTGPDNSATDHSAAFRLDTKALGPGEHTYRIAFFQTGTSAYVAQGTYSSLLIDHTATVDGGIWLSPCRVDAAGNPLKSDGTAAATLEEADARGSYGLRSTSSRANYYVTAASPARAFTSDGNLRYYVWTPNQSLYVSGKVVAYWAGNWLDSRFVYNASEKDALVLKDRRATIKVHIECGQLAEADIQQINLLNRITSARWYVPDGLSANPAHFTGTTESLYDCGGTPMHLVKADSDFYLTGEVYIPPADYSDIANAALRPSIQVLLGSDTSYPKRVKVDITENVEPMYNYTYNLYVSKSSATVTLTAEAWDDGGEHTTTPETHTVGTITLDDWTPVTNTADDWNTL